MPTNPTDIVVEPLVALGHSEQEARSIKQDMSDMALGMFGPAPLERRAEDEESETEED